LHLYKLEKSYDLGTKKMNAKNFFSATIIAYILIVTLSGCSKTTKEAEALPELISAVNFPYIKNNTLYSFDPETEESEVLAETETGLILALDTDQSSEEIDDNNVKTFLHSADAEYFVYANKQTLHLYDPYTRKDHSIYDFKNDITFDPDTQVLLRATESYICDIQKVVTWDEESRLAKNILYKDEFSVYVKTSSNEECIEIDSPYNYWQINIIESSENFTIRRKFLLEHTHKHTHFHDHDVENYEFADLHGHEHPELDDDNIAFDSNNHEHDHTHTHDFLFEASHIHDNLIKDEIDSVHNNLKNQEIKFETLPEFIGEKSSFESIDEALMYSGRPVIDIPNRKFGYLGLNTKEQSYNFYSVKTETLKKALLWVLPNNSFNLLENNYSSLNLTDLEKLSPKSNRFSTFQYINSNILIPVKNKIIFFTLEELFDDDETEAREARIASPLFTSNISNPPLSSRIKYNSSNKKMVITEDKDIWSLDFSTDQIEEEKLIKSFNPLYEPFLINLESTYISDNILIVKNFLDQDIPQSSMVLLQESGLEDLTVLTKTLNSVSTINLVNETLINLSDADFQTRSAEYFSSDLNMPLHFDDSIWSLDTIDYRNYEEKEVASIFSTETNSIEPNTITNPNLYLFDENEPNGQGEDFGSVPQDISGANSVIIFTDLYGLIEVTNTDSTTSMYFFSNQKNSFNFDNEYKNMKLLK
jgi:hypothetical protein